MENSFKKITAVLTAAALVGSFGIVAANAAAAQADNTAGALATPQINETWCVNDGVEISWDAVPGAYEYRGSGTASVTPEYVVTTLDDSFDPNDGATSLREAVYYANDPSKTITFASKLSGTVTLKAQLVAAADIRIDGGGRVALDAQNLSRVILAEAPLTLAGITAIP